MRCPLCDVERFIEGRAQLNTAGLTFLNLDWANRSAATLACVDCGCLEWFLADPEEVPSPRSRPALLAPRDNYV